MFKPPDGVISDDKLELLKRITSKVKFDLPTECWIWQGATAGAGHPHMSIMFGNRQRQISARRVLWYIYHDMPLEGSRHIQLSMNDEVCQNLKLCCNPAHFIATDTSLD